MHKNISKLQQKYKLGGTNLKGQSALQNINRNTALTRKGIYQGLLHRGWEPTNAKRYATQLSMQLRENALEFAKKNGFLNTH
ncbi:MAG: hypothetical protein ABJD66_03830 [Cellulophaga sp.]|uniref:hypothetical protein n=1 Tax=Cellulophaga sp. TaxID=1972202 RepID=UPI003263B8E8